MASSNSTTQQLNSAAVLAAATQSFCINTPTQEVCFVAVPLGATDDQINTQIKFGSILKDVGKTLGNVAAGVGQAAAAVLPVAAQAAGQILTNNPQLVNSLLQ